MTFFMHYIKVHTKGTFTSSGLITCISTTRKEGASHDLFLHLFTNARQGHIYLRRIICLHVISQLEMGGASDDLLSASIHKYNVPTKSLLYVCFLHRTNVQNKFVHNRGLI